MPDYYDRYGYEWATADEDMTEPQERMLWYLSRKHQICLPFLESENATGQRVTKADACVLIDLIKAESPKVTPEYIDSLGRSGPYEGPGHPTTWRYCHDPPTDWQRQWMIDLTKALLIPVHATRKRTAGLTRGQASWLIDILREEKSRFMRPLDEKWLEDAVAECIMEVPLPKAEETDIELPKVEEQDILMGAPEVKVET
ncbi:hypothetical protein K466DRAFT_663606 [Polyporus arcularius HHB13444]|uniref:Uncharacterized protein n=1 Tax=Polyporus arcularius HHB13444 TaxID=1314778 RepID=A0A5C3PCJ3_9APHY|nr:hypothetical protein K466DRAFT_663606 [Polyporus arcularius HHB13444]